MNDRLLNETLAADETVCAASLDVMLHAVRRRRRNRRIRRAGMAAVIVAAVTLFYASHRPHRKAPQVATAPVPPASVSIVVTVPLAPERIVATPPGMVATVQTVSSTVPRVVTGDTPPAGLNVDDDGLFAFLGGRPIAIVRPKGAPAELLLLDDRTIAGSRH